MATKQKRIHVTRDVFQRVRSLLDLAVTPASVAKALGISYQSAWRISKCKTWVDFEGVKQKKLLQFHEKKNHNVAPGLFTKEPAKLVEECRHFWVESRFIPGRLFCARCAKGTIDMQELIPEDMKKHAVPDLQVTEQPRT